MDDNRIRTIRIERRGSTRYLVNGSDVGIDRLQYTTVTLSGNYASSAPTFELEDLPPKSYVPIETVDPYEDGLILWQIGAVDWSDGASYRGAAKRTDRKRGKLEGQRVEREKKKIDETPPQSFDNDT